MTKHRHHIIPKHAGGTDDNSNLIELTIEEHAEEHRKLWESGNSYLDYVAWRALSGQIGSEQARLDAMRYVCSTEEHRQKLRVPKSEEHIKKMLGNKNGFSDGSVPHNKGKHKEDYTTEETRLIWSEKMRGNRNASGERSEDTKQKMRGPRKPWSPEARLKIMAGRDLAKQKRNTNEPLY